MGHRHVHADGSVTFYDGPRQTAEEIEAHRVKCDAVRAKARPREMWLNPTETLPFLRNLCTTPEDALVLDTELHLHGKMEHGHVRMQIERDTDDNSLTCHCFFDYPEENGAL